jgi:hypothetical protein
VVEDRVGNTSTDFWGISWLPSAEEHGPMPPDVVERRLSLLEGAWRFFDEVAARVSPEMRRGSRGGGRDRDEIIAHVFGNERVQFSKRVGATATRSSRTSSGTSGCSSQSGSAWRHRRV